MIKVAESTYKLANEKGCLNIYLTWCMLKSYNSHGTIKRDSESIQLAASYLSKSPSSLRLHLTKLVNLGLVRRHKHSYSLVSYDSGWEILGLDVSKHEKKDRKGNFIIFKVNNIQDLKEQIELAEILVHTQRQAFQARKSILRDEEQFTDAEKNALKKCRFLDLPEFLDKLYVEKLSVLRNVERFIDNTNMVRFCEIQGKKYSFTKITPFLTCERTSVILGYEKNSRTGQNIRRRIQKVDLATFVTRDAEFLDTIPWKNAVKGEILCQKSPQRIKDTGTNLSHRLISKMIVK